MKDQKTLLKRVRTEVARLEKKGEDLSFVSEAMDFVDRQEGPKGIALLLAHQPEIMVFDKLRNFIADLVEIVLYPEEEPENANKLGSVPVILEYKDDEGEVHETDEFHVKRNQVSVGKVKVTETIFEVGGDKINEDRTIDKG